MRRLGCLLFLLVIAGGLYVADLAITRVGQERMERRVSRALDADVSAELRGWPVSVRALLGSIPTASITATDVPLDAGASLDRLDVVLHDVEVDVSDLRGGNGPRRLPPARAGEFEAQLDERSIAGVLGLPGGVTDVRLRDGLVRISAAGLEVDADVAARDGDVVVSFAGPLGQILGATE